MEGDRAGIDPGGRAAVSPLRACGESGPLLTRTSRRIGAAGNVRAKERGERGGRERRGGEREREWERG